MFDFDAGKLMLIATVALVVIGPKDLPRVLRQLGQMVTRVRRMAGEFQNQFMDAMKEADIQDLRDEVAKLKDSATLDVDFNPGKDIKAHLDDAMNMSGPTPATPTVGSTSEVAALHLPASSEIEPFSSIASTGIGPSADVANLMDPPPVVDVPPPEPVADIAIEQGVDADEKRKAVVVRRRLSPDRAGSRGPGWPRSSNILPARRDTSDQ